MGNEQPIELEAGDTTTEKSKRRIGLVATDPLRILGLQHMLGSPTCNADSVDILPLSVPGLLQDATFDVILVDASCVQHLCELISTFRRVRPSVRLIVIGNSLEPEYVQQVIGAGARGYLTHTASESEIRMALEIVSDGSVWAPRKVLARLLDASDQPTNAAKGVTFTAREKDILALLVSGRANREIATALAIDESTVKAHVGRLMRKAGVKNRIELTLFILNLPEELK